MIDDLEGPVGSLDQALNLRLDLAQFLRRGTETRHALLEQRERALEIDLLGLELADNLLEPLESLLEAHGASSCFTSSTRAETRPSRSTRLNGMSRSKPRTDVSAWPSSARATA